MQLDGLAGSAASSEKQGPVQMLGIISEITDFPKSGPAS